MSEKVIRLKDHKDIEGIRRASDILSSVLLELRNMVKPGMSTGDLDDEAYRMVRQHGATPSFKGYQGYPATLCTSVNDEVIHGIPGKREVQEGDILGIDCGIIYNGYFSDAAITVPVGSVNDQIRRFLQVTEESLYKGIEASAVGKKIRDISQAIYRHLIQHGYGVIHAFCGHGVGFELHEDPSVPNYVIPENNIRIEEGLVIAIEPMATMCGSSVRQYDDGWTVCTLDGSWAAHFEHTVAFVHGKAEILTI